MICDCGEFINEQNGLCQNCHVEVTKQLAQQKALLDEAEKLIRDIAWNTLIGDDDEYPEYSGRIEAFLAKVKK